MVSYSIALIFMFGLLEQNLSFEYSGRAKRFIVYPRGGSFKIVIGIGTPVKLGSKQSMAIGWNLQMQYAVPQNATALESYPPVYTGKRSLDIQKQKRDKSDRAILYSAFEDIFDSEHLNGRQCLLRSICENAMDPLDHDANGLYGKIFHIFLTPDYGDETDPEIEPIYLEAKYAGEYGIKCKSLYSDCKLKEGLLHLFTVLDT